MNFRTLLAPVVSGVLALACLVAPAAGQDWQTSFDFPAGDDALVRVAATPGEYFVLTGIDVRATATVLDPETGTVLRVGTPPRCPDRGLDLRGGRFAVTDLTPAGDSLRVTITRYAADACDGSVESVTTYALPAGEVELTRPFFAADQRRFYVLGTATQGRELLRFVVGVSAVSGAEQFRRVDPAPRPVDRDVAPGRVVAVDTLRGVLFTYADASSGRVELAPFARDAAAPFVTLSAAGCPGELPRRFDGGAGGGYGYLARATCDLADAVDYRVQRFTADGATDTTYLSVGGADAPRSVVDIDVLPSGDVIAVGNSGSPVRPGGGTDLLFALRFLPSGDTAWTVTYPEAAAALDMRVAATRERGAFIATATAGGDIGALRVDGRRGEAVSTRAVPRLRFAAYPNPARDLVRVSGLAAASAPRRYRLRTTDGRLAREGSLTPAATGAGYAAEASVAGLAPGTYVLELGAAYVPVVLEVQ